MAWQVLKLKQRKHTCSVDYSEDLLFSINCITRHAKLPFSLGSLDVISIHTHDDFILFSHQYFIQQLESGEVDLY